MDLHFKWLQILYISNDIHSSKPLPCISMQNKSKNRLVYDYTHSNVDIATTGKAAMEKHCIDTFCNRLLFVHLNTSLIWYSTTNHDIYRRGCFRITENGILFSYKRSK